MGSYFTEDSTLRNETYVIGFTSYRGTAARFMAKVYKTEKPRAGGFENWVDKDFQYSFVDFKRFNKRFPYYSESFYMKCSITSPFHRNEKADWNKVFDGVFYIKDTYSCNE